MSQMKKTLLKVLIILALACAVLFAGVRAYKALTDQSHMDETFYQVESDKLVSNVRAVFLSDLHLSSFGKDNDALVERVRQLKPDLILIGGDMNNRKIKDYAPVLSLCRQLLNITDQVYYALGNHEVFVMLNNGRAIYNDIIATGVIMLHNTVARAQVGDNVLYLAGVSQVGGDVAKYSGGVIEKLAAEDGFKLMLSHYPSNISLISPYDIDLTLSGHLHGGQVVLPYFDGLYSADSGFFPDYTEGRFERNGTTLIVSRGLGNSSRLPRVNNNPELVIVDMSSSAVAYNSLQLLSEYDAVIAKAKATLAPAPAQEEGASGGMLALLEEARSRNRALNDNALATPAPTATPTPAP